MVVNGKQMSLKDISASFGISESTIRERRRCGISLMEPIKRGRIGTILSYNGEKLCISGWARKFGVTREAVRQRLARGQKIGEIAKVYGF